MRSRIDLDGVSLTDPANPYMTLAVFRFRTKEGVVLLIPESAEKLVPWSAIERASVDLVAGKVEIGLAPDYVAKESWLRGARHLTGEWLDRRVLTAVELGLLK
ncbi:MAG: hypothetical protein IPG45_19175 [Deltaproteobacteria bacterium]|jgi:hypothetical protein|nr:hypothetical protein [Deltaproteobacteria bacterium]